MGMERWRGWLCFNFKNSFLTSTKGTVLKLTSHLRYRARENRHGMRSLYGDIEAFREDGDIQMMWEMIHSSYPPISCDSKSRRRSSYWRFCFRPAWF